MLSRRTKVILISLPVAIVLAVMQMHKNHTAPLLHGDLEIHSIWSRATAPGAPGVVYLTVTNRGDTADRLAGARTDVGDAMLHTMTMDAGVMKMRHLENGRVIGAGETVEFMPKTDHIMLVNLKQPLKQGQKLSLTLVFEKAGPFDVPVAVGAADADAAGEHATH